MTTHRLLEKRNINARGRRIRRKRVFPKCGAVGMGGRGVRVRMEAFYVLNSRGDHDCWM